MQRNELILATYHDLQGCLLDCSMTNPEQKDIIIASSKLVTEDMCNAMMLASRHTLDKTKTFSNVRQIIPYVVVSRERVGQEDLIEYAVYSRSAPTEERLKDGCSLGFGGHIDADDVVFENSIPLFGGSVYRSSFRELEEELGITDIAWHSFRMNEPLFLLSKLTEVDRLHVGIVFEVRLHAGFNERIEKGLNFVGWYTETEIHELVKLGTCKFETWSTAIIDRGLSELA